MLTNERSTIAKINRRIRAGCKFRKSSPRAVQSFGPYNVIDTTRNVVIDWGIQDPEAYLADLERLGKELYGPKGAIEQYQQLRKLDAKLPADPSATYADDWKGWSHFLAPNAT